MEGIPSWPWLILRYVSAKTEAKEYSLVDGNGIFSLVHPNGSKYWRFRFRFGGKQHLMAFGVYPEVSLADSRQKRDAAKLQTFPDDYFFQGNRIQQFHQVGNAAPPFLAYNIAKIVLSIFEDTPKNGHENI